MPQGPGKFDAECEELLKEHHAEVVMVVVLGGKRGSGFSLSTTNPQRLPEVIKVMRSAADQIEKDMLNALGGGG